MKDDFLQKSSFLQSAEWEKLQNSVGRKTWKIDDVLVIQHRLPFGPNYLYCPRPQAVDEKFFEETRVIAGQERSVFLKVDPTYELSLGPTAVGPGSRPTLVSLGTTLTNYEYKKSDSLQPIKTVVLDLRKTEEELLGQMREKTRYNIRLAERYSVQIVPRPPSATGIPAKGLGTNRKSQIDEFNQFWRMLQETAGRDKFDTHERGYYQKLLEISLENFSNELFFAEYKGKVLAAALINFYKPSATATYLHGASTREYKEVMAPHLLHWWVIKEAKKRGFNYYDFWGIDEIKWPGVTKFKLGFGGSVIEYPPTVDIIYRPALYKIYQLVKNCIRLIRNLS